ncbi:MAG: hypothetical protein FWD25_11780 [Clostridia bacterium]|nr:hypothetical protein [Clostridia bacterium]
MFYVLLFVATLALPVCAAAWQGRRAEAYLPYGFILATLIAFCFGLADALPAGAVVAGLFLLVCWGLALWRTAQKQGWRTLFSNVFTPGMLLYTVLFVCIVYIQKDRTVCVQDDYNYWFRAWRAMWVDQKLPLYPGSGFMFHQSYPPGLPTMHYLGSMLRGDFVQGDAFCIYGIFCISMVMPLCTSLTWRRAWLLPAAAFAALLLPTTFHLQYDSIYSAYHSLGGDAALGMAFGLALFVACVENPKPGRLARLSLLCAMITLVKPSGFSIALIALMAAVVMGIVRERSWRSLGLLALSACLPVLLYMLWRWKLTELSVDVVYGVRFDAGLFLDLLLRRDASYRTEMFSAFLRFPWQRLAVANPYNAFSTPQLRHFMVVALLALPALGLLTLGDRTARSRHATGIVSIAMGYVFYALGMLMVYLFSVPRLGGAEVLPSFDRYMGTYYQAALVCLFGWMAKAATSGSKKERITARAALAYLLALTALIVPVQQTYTSVVALRNDHLNPADYMVRYYDTPLLGELNERAAYIVERVPTDATVGLYYLRFAHHGQNVQAVAYPLHTVPKNALPPVGPPEAPFRHEGWQEVRGFDYVYIAQAGEDFASAYGFLFEGGLSASQQDWAVGQLYRVRLDGDAGLTFLPMSLTSSKNLIE